MGWVWLDGVGDMAKEKAREASRDPPHFLAALASPGSTLKRQDFRPPIPGLLNENLNFKIPQGTESLRSPPLSSSGVRAPGNL